MFYYINICFLYTLFCYIYIGDVINIYISCSPSDLKGLSFFIAQVHNTLIIIVTTKQSLDGSPRTLMFGLAQSPPWQVRAKCSILWTPPLKPKTMEPSFSAAVFIYVGNYGSIFSLGFDKISVAFKKEKKKGKL